MYLYANSISVGIDKYPSHCFNMKLIRAEGSWFHYSENRSI
jgi:hypothetical protein